MNNPKILILGSLSYVGTFLVKYLEINHDVQTLEKITNKRLDLDQQNIEILIPEFDKYDLIINLIHDHSNNIKKNLHINNLILTKINNHQKLIFFSSSQVTENNLNKYTLIKEEIEKSIKHKNSNYVILRPCLMVEEKINKSGLKEQFLLTLLSILKKYKIAIMLANGKFYLNLVSIFDIFKIIEKIINKDMKNETITIYNEKSLSFSEVISILRKEFNIIIFEIPIPLFVLKIISKIFPKKLPNENIEALKFEPTKFSDLETRNTDLHFFQDNASILKKLFQSL